jgi:hypothetical protein
VQLNRRPVSQMNGYSRVLDGRLIATHRTWAREVDSHDVGCMKKPISGANPGFERHDGPRAKKFPRQALPHAGRGATIGAVAPFGLGVVVGTQLRADYAALRANTSIRPVGGRAR